MTLQKEQSVQTTSLLAGEERRRSKRVVIRVPVTLALSGGQKDVVINAHTVDVSMHGAMVLCPRPIDNETEFEILNDRTNERTRARVVRRPRETANGFLIPIEFNSPATSFWQISFPAKEFKFPDN